MPEREPQKEAEKQRVIIESGRHDAWRTHHFSATELNIATDATQLQFKDSYILSLVGNWTQEGMEEIKPLEKQVITTLDSRILYSLERPTTVITEDGRVFHDLSLQTEGNPNADRLDSILTTLHRDFAGFNPVTALHEKQRKYQEQAAYHSTGFGRITLPTTPLSVTAPGEMDRIIGLGRKR